jgi:hypothetical protein
MVWHRTFARLAERADVHPGLKKVRTILAIFELFGNGLARLALLHHFFVIFFHFAPNISISFMNYFLFRCGRSTTRLTEW